MAVQENNPVLQSVAPLGKRVHLISLGCARNRVDSEAMLGDLFRRGWSHVSEPDSADAIVVNTCGFIEAAKEESIDTILESAAYKKTNPNLKLVVTGCLTQRYKKQLAKSLPEVDLFLGTSEFVKLAELIEQDLAPGTIFAKQQHYIHEGHRINTLSKAAAYVKVAEGCQHNCSFCIIPAIRGKLRSRHIPNVVAEVEQLVSQGVLEVSLIAQDLAAFGRDRGKDELLDLLKALVCVEGLRWIRLLYVYPENLSDEMIEFIATQEKIVKYIDIPMQHASDPILKKMNRALNQQEMREVVARVRKRIPDMYIRTTVMVGFPGETEADVAELLRFVADMRFEHLGCFSYSQEEGTVAGRMQDQVDEAIKKTRQEQVMQLQQTIAREHLQKHIGRIYPVLVNGPMQKDARVWEGRLPFQAPEVDGVVYINDGPVKAGAIQTIEIVEALDYDLIGRIVGDKSSEATSFSEGHEAHAKA